MSYSATTGLLIIVGLLLIAWGVRIARRVASFARPPATPPSAAPVPPPPAPAMPSTVSPDPHALCPVCLRPSDPLAVIDFNKTCEDGKGKVFGNAGVPVGYHGCSHCRFIFAPAMQHWTQADFTRWIFNESFVLADPDSTEVRPKVAAQSLTNMFGFARGKIRHLDYGGGDGALSRNLRQLGWDSNSYDPLVDSGMPVESLGQFDLVSAVEVFTQVADPRALMKTLTGLLKPDGVIVFSTIVSDNEIDQGLVNWWYAAPRTGHISLYHSATLDLLAAEFNLRHLHGGTQWHVFVGPSPAWAPDLFPAAVPAPGPVQPA